MKAFAMHAEFEVYYTVILSIYTTIWIIVIKKSTKKYRYTKLSKEREKSFKILAR